MKKVIISFFAFAIILFGNISFAQQGADFKIKEMKNFHSEYFEIGQPGANLWPGAGSFRGLDGGYYIYGQYKGSAVKNKIDNVTLHGLDKNDFFLVKFDENHKAVWGKVFNDKIMRRMKVIQGPDSLIYVFATSLNNFIFESINIPNPSTTNHVATYLVKLDHKTGNPKDGYLIGKGKDDFHRYLMDATIDHSGNVFVSLYCTKANGANPDSLRFNKVSAPWKRNNDSKSRMTAIIKYNSEIEAVWAHSIGAHFANPVARLDFVNDHLIVSGHVRMQIDEWKNLYFDDSLFMNTSHNTPYGQDDIGFILKIHTNGELKWVKPWLNKYDGDDAPGIMVHDMKTDKQGNIYCFLTTGDQLTRFDTSWYMPKVVTAQKMAKFNPEG
jgi:hypothetical protein